jgi:hypothetical protein
MPDSVESAAAPTAPPKRPPRTWPDSALVLLVVAFGFLAASTTARNSDLWRHLAVGRLLSDGQYQFGKDPFGYTTEDSHWANHAWLADCVLFKAYSAVGGGGLVALKAALAALTVLFMLGSARGAGLKWVVAGVSLVAVTTLVPWLLLQPGCASLLLLALCLWLFRRGSRAFIALPVVIIAWVNLDEWYFLGPLLVGLCSAGRWLWPSADVPRPPVWLVPACLGACLVSPDHIRGLTLPAELSPAVWTSDFADDPRFDSLFASPWQWRPLGAAGGFNLSAWAFWVLLGLGLVSFAVNRRAALGWRGLTWLGFAILACFLSRLVPFFAVVAGPITALNLREVVPAEFLRRPGRALVGLFAVLLIALTWPGSLQGYSARDRGLAWAVAPDPSLELAARVVKQWRDDGILPPGSRTFATHPDLANHLEWFCPGERVFLDSRFKLFAAVAPPFESLSRSLGLLAKDSAATNPGDAADLLREYGIGCVLLYDPDPRRLTAGLREVATDRERWEEVAVEGFVVAVRPVVGGSEARPFQSDRQAFGSSSSDPLPPVSGVTLAAEPAPIWSRRNRPRRVAWQGDAAFVYLRLFEIEGVGSATLGKSLERSPALPILAARGARTAVAAGPADDAAWLSLARAYLFQSRITWEATAGRGFPLLAPFRQAQAATALVQSVMANPENVAGHDALAGLYGERGFIDLAVRHRREQWRLTRETGPAPGEAATAFADRRNRLTTTLEEMENALQDAENRFLVQTHGLAGDPLGRARTAARLGLAGRAIEVLTTSHADLYGAEGLRLLLEMLLWTGQAADARALLDRDEVRRNPDMLGLHEIPGGVQNGRPWSYQLHAFDWFDLCQSAAAGRYTAAGGAAARLRARFEAQMGAARVPMTRGTAHMLASQTGLPALPGAAWGLLYASWERLRVADFVAHIHLLAAQDADLHALEGLLHLERGAIDAAAEHFELAERVYAEAIAAPVRPGKSFTDRYLAAIREAGR